ncbi:MAG: efflux RND transporter periplasmic adaptor subunit [Ignavibacteria bacterium]|nr:efflux RND transporter periplasmic adaptor subunit [Ignavibacteria bacterium]MBP7093134.1 efflux RND transporter periplasmic adaptor subunit [Candidatus Kapabacteria bacterium]MBK6418561.1 efflux RND transporter periplasmic adaptor subunit [Ignavibacteria bacterium]MBK6760525.1 efflux RND transporter periplasmic adaptor subunit [Ignavibacteria bacterium]MBK7186034.1 efflux RND transporter periplasmic adaptor subunit [Ignavibacteria bacterium]
MIRWTVGIALLIGITVLTGCHKEEAGPPPPMPVKVATVEVRDVPIYNEWVGQTRGGEEVEIRARVEGYLDRVVYKEGTFVKRGQVMYIIDPLQYSANVSVARGELAESEANLARSQQDVVRYKPLVEQNAISRQEYETAVQLEKASLASVQARKGSVQKAQLELGYCSVTSPIDGLAGKTQVEAGDLVSRMHGNLLTTVSKLDPIKVQFSISELEWINFVKSRASRKASGDTGQIEFQMILADKIAHPYPGRAVVIDNAVDPETGTILIEALFPNPDGEVRPGQFAKVRAVVERRPGAVVVPQRAISELQGAYRVAVVGSDNVVKMRPVVVRNRVGGAYVIEAGLKAGERIVIEGLQKVRDGVKVAPQQVTVPIDSLLNRP